MKLTTNCNIKFDKADTYCGRGDGKLNNPIYCRPRDRGVWGNPVILNKPCPICQSIHRESGSTLKCYEKYLHRRINEDAEFRSAFFKLRGKKLGCFCKPELCHTDIMVDYLNKRRLTPEFITQLADDEVFVFGSNSTGFHGAGASGYAFRNNSDYNWRNDKFFIEAMNSSVGSKQRIGKWAIYGVARGFQVGISGKSYAIETIRKPGMKRSTPLSEIAKQVEELCAFAKTRNDLNFLVTPIGCQLAGYSEDEIKKIFTSINVLPDNIILPLAFEFRGEETTGREYDGIDHINVYSKGNTELGRMLSNFAYAPFECEDGKFNSIEGYWYWLKMAVHPARDKLRQLHGYEAKKYGKEIAKDVPGFILNEDEEFIYKIKRAISIKIKTHQKIADLFKKSSLPLEHYYVYNGKRVDAGFKWILDHLETIRVDLQKIN